LDGRYAEKANMHSAQTENGSHTNGSHTQHTQHILGGEPPYLTSPLSCSFLGLCDPPSKQLIEACDNKRRRYDARTYNLNSRHDFPTPESPIRTNLKRWS